MVSVHSSLRNLKWNESWLLTFGPRPAADWQSAQFLSHYIGPCMVYLDSCSRTSWPSIEKYRGKSSQNCHVVLFWEPKTSKNLMHWVLSCICLRSTEGLNIVKDKSWYAIIVLLMLSQVDPGLLSLSQKYSEPILIKVATKWEISNWKYGNCYVFGEFATQTKTLIAVLNGGQIIAIQLLKCSD